MINLLHLTSRFRSVQLGRTHNQQFVYVSANRFVLVNKTAIHRHGWFAHWEELTEVKESPHAELDAIKERAGDARQERGSSPAATEGGPSPKRGQEAKKPSKGHSQHSQC
jgi:hypothetical protein